MDWIVKNEESLNEGFYNVKIGTIQRVFTVKLCIEYVMYSIEFIDSVFYKTELTTKVLHEESKR